MSAGSSASQFSSPNDAFVDGNFNIYIADYGNNRIQRYRSGLSDNHLKHSNISDLSILGATSANTLAGFSLGGGSTYSELRNPTAIFVDLSGAMYIADMSNFRVQKWLPNEPLGYTVAGGRGNGATLDKLGFVYGIFVDHLGNIYVSENSNHRVTLWFAWNTTAGQIVGCRVGMFSENTLLYD